MFTVYINCLHGLLQHNGTSGRLTAATDAVLETDIFRHRYSKMNNFAIRQYFLAKFGDSFPLPSCCWVMNSLIHSSSQKYFHSHSHPSLSFPIPALTPQHKKLEIKKVHFCKEIQLFDALVTPHSHLITSDSLFHIRSSHMGDSCEKVNKTGPSFITAFSQKQQPLPWVSLHSHSLPAHIIPISTAFSWMPVRVPAHFTNVVL